MAGVGGAEEQLRQASTGFRVALISRRSRAAVDVVWAGAAVCALAWFALSLAHEGRVAAIWPANAIILARLVRMSPRRWAAYLLAGLIGNICGDMLTGDAPLGAAVLSFCNSLEIIACATVVRRFIGAKPDLSRPRQLAIYAGAVVLASASAAFIAASWLAHGHRPFLRSLVEWTLADTLGLMVVAPALMALDRPGLRFFLTRGKRLRNLGMVALLLAMIALVGLQPHHQFSYLIFAALMVIAYKGETTGAAVGLLSTGGAFMALTAFGIGPGAGSGRDPMLEAILVQLFMLAGAVIAFPIAGAMTRRRELQAALAVTARDFQMLAENSTDIILRIDRDLKVVYISPSCRQLGYEPAQLTGHRVDVLVSPDEHDSIMSNLEALMRGELVPPPAFERQLRTAAGDFVWVEGSPKVLVDDDGRPAGMVTQLRDITARRAAQAALAQSEARYRLLADLATDIIMRMDANGVVRYISPSCRLLGYEADEMIGKSAFDFLHPDEHEVAQDRSEALFRGEPRQAGEGREYRVVTKHGDVVWLEGMSALSRNEAGELVDIVSHLRDVTERRAFEDELRRKRAEAEAATLAKSEFLANMSHEIRTPLTGIMGFAGLLLEEQDSLSPTARTFATRIATASRTLLTVVNDILDFSKIEAGQVELDSHPLDPSRFVVETMELVSAQAQEKGLELNAAIDGALPPAVAADGSRLRQVLLNLLTNAIKFTDAGGVTVTVAHDGVDGGRLKISVTDSGVGIAPERLHRLFQRFSQADGSISRQYGGTGLGLAICKSLTGLMGGDIGVDSAPGLGAEFWFTVKAPACEPEGVTDADGAGAFDARPARILIVDDSPVNRELVTVLLGVFGHDLSEACGGAEAVMAAEQTPFDLILMDLQMPGMDGLAATRAIRAGSPFNRATPIVALSANILPTHLVACREAGMNDHIGKPIDTRELLTKVARWTGPEATAQAAMESVA
jgi:PAS domain S-box-containing protein